MALYNEQVAKSGTKENSGFKKWCKRQTNKLMRRLGKKYLDEAPTKNGYRGYLS